MSLAVSRWWSSSAHSKPSFASSIMENVALVSTPMQSSFWVRDHTSDMVQKYPTLFYRVITKANFQCNLLLLIRVRNSTGVMTQNGENTLCRDLAQQSCEKCCATSCHGLLTGPMIMGPWIQIFPVFLLLIFCVPCPRFRQNPQVRRVPKMQSILSCGILPADVFLYSHKKTHAIHYRQSPL